MGENGNGQKTGGRLLTPAAKYLERSYNQAVAERRQWFKKSSPLGCGLLILIGLALPFLFYFSIPVKPVVKLIVLVVYGLAFSASVLIAILYSRGSIIPMPQIFSRYEKHVRHVLFDERLLALLLADSGRDLPGMAFATGLVGQPEILQAVDPNSLEQRLVLLQSNYEAVCKHFHIQPYPEPVAGKRLPLIAPAPFRLARVAVAIILYEALIGSSTIEEQGENDKEQP